MAIKYLDLAGGNDANTGVSWAQAWKTFLHCTAANGVSAGDTIRIAKTADPTNIGSITWTNDNATLTLASARTINIDLCETAWTASANVVATADATLYKQGSKSSKLAVAGAFTTGLIAYRAFGAIDLSSKQKISFWIYVDVEIPANTLRLDLCSDAAGVTPVNSVTIDFILRAGRWTALDIDTGGALGASIQSVALTALLDPGTVNIYLDNIFATNDLCLRGVISKDSADEHWWGIQSIDNVTVILASSQMGAATVTKYYGTTEAVTSYVREGVIFDAAGIYSVMNQINVSGSASAQVLFSGGWNTATTTQDGYTMMEGRGGLGIMFDWGSSFNITFERAIISGCFWAFNGSNANGNVLQNIYVSNGGSYGIQFASNTRQYTYTNIYICQVLSGLNIEDDRHILSNIFISSCPQAGLAIQYSSNLDITNLRLRGNYNNIAFGYANIGLFVRNATLSSAQSGYDLSGLSAALINCKFLSTYFNSANSLYSPALVDFPYNDIKSYDHNGISGDYRRFTKWGIDRNDTVIYRTISPSARLTPNSSTNKLSSTYKTLVLKNPETLPTVTVWIRKSISTDAGGANYNGAQPRLMLMKKEEVGIMADTVLATATGATLGTWQMLQGTIPSIPTRFNDLKEIPLEIFVDCDGTAGWINVDELKTNQENAIIGIFES